MRPCDVNSARPLTRRGKPCLEFKGPLLGTNEGININSSHLQLLPQLGALCLRGVLFCLCLWGVHVRAAYLMGAWGGEGIVSVAPLHLGFCLPEALPQ